MRKIFLVILVTIIVVFFWASINMGFYKSVKITTQDYPEMTLVYKVHTGPYHKILPMLEDVEKWASEQHIDCHKSFAHFLDDPNVKEHARLKSHVGCWLDGSATYTLTQDLVKKTIPQQNYVVAEFLGSPAIGPFKVYGAVKDYFAEHKWPMSEDVIEIYERYDKDKLKTYYLFKVSQ